LEILTLRQLLTLNTLFLPVAVEVMAATLRLILTSVKCIPAAVAVLVDIKLELFLF
jgi:hypothetical protein